MSYLPLNAHSTTSILANETPGNIDRNRDSRGEKCFDFLEIHLSVHYPPKILDKMDKGQSDSSLNVDNLDIDDYMDIVTTYKCRFCSFTSSLPQGISNHVRKFHVQQQMQTELQFGLNTANENNNKVTEKTDSNTIKNSQERIGNEKVQVVSEETSIVSMAPIMTSFADIGTDTLPEIREEAVVSEYSDVKDNNTNSNDSKISNSIVVDMNTGCQTEGFGEEINNIVIIEERPEDKDVKNNGVTMDVDGKTGPESLTQRVNSPPVTKELFLCGQCSNAFNSIDECKTHMIQDHNVDTEEQTTSKVSVATQVEGKKKVGRKRKSAVITEPEEQDSDSDWDDAKEYVNRGSRSRRTIRPPKALKEDYYLGKRKKKEKPEVLRDYKEKCPQIGCYAKFKTEESLQIHLKCHVEGEYHFKCIECSVVEQLWKNLRFHLWKQHKIDTDLLTCDVCGKFKADTLSKLLVHKEVHSSERPYTCDVCGKGFKQFSQMRNHQMIHSEHQSDDPNKWYKNKECSVCKRQFANQKSLAKHIQAVHSKIKPFICPFCGHAAARKAMMQLHIRTHTGEKPYKCDVCQYTTGDHNSLRRHKMRHTGQKKYQCQYCGYACIQAISLKMHVKNKHPGSKGVFCCNICTFRTVNEKNYNNHIEDHKNGLIPDVPQQSNEQAPQIIIASGPGQGQTISLDSLEEIQAEELHGHEIIEIHTEHIASHTENNQLQMQVQTLESGETQISADDLARLSSCEGLVPSNITAAQLIYSALSAISQNENTGNEASSGFLNGVQTSVASSGTKDGITTHTITFHLPGSDSNADNNSTIDAASSGVSLQVSAEPKQSQAQNETRIFRPLFIDSANIQEIPQGATIQDLAQVSCLIKDSLFTENSAVVEAVTVEQVGTQQVTQTAENSTITLN
ncbi:hypothetical protein KUTeg_019291 [Tegillarca granosa]|uniref:C2H2-type domain-containing protein n=1 Tax=Tegillarca granosa TaxID=220873 RepID=A0ABQ9EHI7_TEGGR|nr:hypothetical protein KUTeg_019291 [Tegillarca granosa]